MSVAANRSEGYNPFLLVGVLTIATLFAIALIGYNIFAFGGLLALIVFVLFIRHPEWGVYVTTGLLLLQGSSGVLSTVGSNTTLAITTAQIAGAATLFAWVIGSFLRHERFRW